MVSKSRNQKLMQMTVLRSTSTSTRKAKNTRKTISTRKIKAKRNTGTEIEVIT
jgi:hypothetical protein